MAGGCGESAADPSGGGRASSERSSRGCRPSCSIVSRELPMTERVAVRGSLAMKESGPCCFTGIGSRRVALRLFLFSLRFVALASLVLVLTLLAAGTAGAATDRSQLRQRAQRPVSRQSRPRMERRSWSGTQINDALRNTSALLSTSYPAEGDQPLLRVQGVAARHRTTVPGGADDLSGPHERGLLPQLRLWPTGQQRDPGHQPVPRPIRAAKPTTRTFR